MTISGPGWPPPHICLPGPSLPGPQNPGIDALSRKYISLFKLYWIMTISGPGWPPAHICPPQHLPRPPQNPGIDALPRKYHFSVQILLDNDHLGAWRASGPYLPSPAPQNPGNGALSRKYHFSIQTPMDNDHLGAWMASGRCLSPRPPPQNPGIGALSRKYHFAVQNLLDNDHVGAWLASGPYLLLPESSPAPRIWKLTPCPASTISLCKLPVHTSPCIEVMTLENKYRDDVIPDHLAKGNCPSYYYYWVRGFCEVTTSWEGGWDRFKEFRGRDLCD